MITWLTLNGLSNYEDTVNFMENKVEEIIKGESNNTIMLIEYNDVYTVGNNYHPDEILSSSPLNLIHTNRGGKITYHGPGQRIIYPIVKLDDFSLHRDIKKYVNTLSEWTILALKAYGISGYCLKDQIGVWVNNNDHYEKIASIGIRIRKWVAYHGIAININSNLEKFNKIIPCGLRDTKMTSLKQLGINTTLTEFDDVLKSQFDMVFKNG